MQPVERFGKMGLWLGIAAGLLFACLSLGLESHSALIGIGVFLLIPGIIGAIALTGNVHAFPLSIVAAVNFLFYFLLCWFAGVVIQLVRRRRNSS